MEIFNIILGFGTVALGLSMLWVLWFQNNSLLQECIRTWGLWLAFGLTSLTVLGSVIYSSVWNLPPCLLCWYQRIVMFPLPILFVIALYIHDTRVWVYTRVLAGVGVCISGYQAILQTGVFGRSLFCEPGSIESCSIPEIQVFGFITIPLMAFIAFLAIFVLSHIAIRSRVS